MKTRLWKTRISILLAILFLLPVCAKALVIKDFNEDGTITDSNYFDVVNIWNIATVDMIGGYVTSCYLYDTAILNYTDGDIQSIVAGENSTVNVHSDYDTAYSLYDYSKVYLHNGSSGFLQLLIVSGNAQLHIYGYDLVYTPDDPGSPDFVDGYWEASHQSFHMGVRYAGGITPQIFLHEIPEPCSGLLLASLILLIKFKRLRNNRK
ncbi:MAG: hypothetical protein NTW93_05855 [Phycisphaerae bacterium]|nr:hypothetical protein [Phycisphaerae bacterium]